MAIELIIKFNTTKRGFTLIELVITMVLTAIIFSVTAVFIVQPINAFRDVARRTQLVDIAESSIRRMERDIRRALPNSLRVKNSGQVYAIEVINVVEGTRYRALGPGTNNTILSFSAPQTDFNVLGPFVSAGLGNNGYRVVIYNLGSYNGTSDNPLAGVNAYASLTASGAFPPIGTHVITPVNTIVTLSNNGSEGHINLNPGFQFALASPRQRVYIIDTPVTYLCDLATGTITRYDNYAINDMQPVNANVAPLVSANSALVANNVQSCNITYAPGTSTRNGVVTINLTIMQNNEAIRLLQQISVNNVA